MGYYNYFGEFTLTSKKRQTASCERLGGWVLAENFAVMMVYHCQVKGVDRNSCQVIFEEVSMNDR